MTGLEFDNVDVLGPVYVILVAILTAIAFNHLVIVGVHPPAKYSIEYSCVIVDYVGQSQMASFEVHQGNDRNNNPWIGLIMSETVRLIM